MARFDRVLGRNRDIPQLESINLNASSAAGTGGDYEHPIAVVPNLASFAPTGAASILPLNAMTLRLISLIFEASITGAPTNNFTLHLRQRRGGNFLVNTASATTITAGLNTVTPASMANITVNTQLLFSGGTGAAEIVTVQSVGGTSFTANFLNGHSGAYTITAAPLASITFGSGANASAFTPIQLVAIPNLIKAGDVITLQRVSNGTGLLSPALTVCLEWIGAGTL